MKKYKVLTAFVLAMLFLLICGCALFVPEDAPAGTSSGENTSVPSDHSSTQSNPSASTDDESGEPDIGTSGSDIIDLPFEEDTVISFVACGDNLIHPSVYFNAMRNYAEANGTTCDYNATNDSGYDFLPTYEHVADAMKNADICYINQETLSGGPGTQIDGYPKFNTPIAMGRDLATLGVDIVNMAHNHMLDAGNDSLLKYSDEYFKSLGMTPLGYYKDEADTDNIVIYEEQGVKIALLTYTYSTNGIPCYSETYIPYFEEPLIRRQIALAKEQADVVIVSAHWGWEDAYKPNSDQKYYASLFCELGVDVVIGMHSHCLQPAEWMEHENGNRMLLTYSLGNFVSGMQNALNVLEGMLSFDIRKDGETGEITVENPVITPLVLHYEKESSVNYKLDTGYRKFKLYELKDYTDELLAKHGVVVYEKNHSSTLYGGSFSIENMYTTVQTIIPAEFLPEEYR